MKMIDQFINFVIRPPRSSLSVPLAVLISGGVPTAVQPSRTSPVAVPTSQTELRLLSRDNSAKEDDYPVPGRPPICCPEAPEPEFDELFLSIFYFSSYFQL
ncbi:hypothetical protein M5K25_015849 [Dendrobium thyrsiflorum]|uniref:Uncharacterized protein n=1 Tax=Dendrobium thyrsiflorum TaxID=117978 RepID=A0ABD0UZC9_DENTH